MKIAVVGGGIFGVTAALELGKAGHEVTLFERKPKILMGASGINQYRVHRGYHYPRSPETIKSALSAEGSFRELYKNIFVECHDHYYAIAREGSKVNAKHFRELCERFGLYYREEDPGILNLAKIEAVFKVEECLIDPEALYGLSVRRLAEAGISLKLGKEVNIAEIENIYDHVVVAAYAYTNEVLGEKGERSNYQFEICEKPIAKLPKKFLGKSIVVIDGPFMCFDPYGDTDLHVMGNVVHAIHASNVGLSPNIPQNLKPLLDSGIIKNPKISSFNKFIDSALDFFPEIEKTEHVGSMYTVRTVLPNNDETDARPTLVRRASEKVSYIFSGKFVECVNAARELVKHLDPLVVDEPLSQSGHPSGALAAF